MSARLFHIAGPLFINSYGLCVAIGVFVFLWFVKKEIVKTKIVTLDQFFNALYIGLISGVLGGHIIELLITPPNSFWDIFIIWDGGFSMLGTFIGVIVSVFIYLRRIHAPVLEFFDLVSVYTPLLQAISRIGCFLAGCCHGVSTLLPWGVIYTDVHSYAPLYCKIHPTQLYSALILFGIFLFLKFVFKKHRPGEVFLMSLMLMLLERFLVEFLRADREFFSFFHLLSIHQCLSLVLFVISLVLYLIYL